MQPQYGLSVRRIRIDYPGSGIVQYRPTPDADAHVPTKPPSTHEQCFLANPGRHTGAGVVGHSFGAVTVRVPVPVRVPVRVLVRVAWGSGSAKIAVANARRIKYLMFILAKFIVGEN